MISLEDIDISLAISDISDFAVSIKSSSKENLKQMLLFTYPNCKCSSRAMLLASIYR